MRFRTFLILFIGIVLFLSSCTKIKDLINPPTPREAYSREFNEDDPQFEMWQLAYERSMYDSLSINMPYSETGQFRSDDVNVYSYNVTLYEGEIFHFDLLADSVNARIFIDFFKKTGDTLDTYEVIAQNKPYQRTVTFETEETGAYKIILQPALDVETPFAMRAYTQPSYRFPVAGHDNSAIRSFWGDPRDAGRRQHEGVDIFAPRGTPVIAADNGRIRYTGERGLGGKQVWLRTELFGGKSLYYAHLDSIADVEGSVDRGDTLGFVGNSGNAVTTPPHLHFGIYERGGAVNPLPFIYQRNRPELPEFPNRKPRELVVNSALANLRMAATMQGEKVGEAVRGDTLELLGQSGNWRHIKTVDEMRAYIHQSLVE